MRYNKGKKLSKLKTHYAGAGIRRIIVLLLILAITISSFYNRFCILDLHKRIDADIACQAALTISTWTLSDRVISLERENCKPDFVKLQKANVRLKIGDGCGSGTVVRIENGYIYVLTAEHCTPGKKRETYEVEVPIKNKDYKKEGRSYLKGCKYITVDRKDIYRHEEYDIALIRFLVVEGHDLEIISPAKKIAEVGDTIYAVGNPVDTIDNITKGLFSSKATSCGIDSMVISSGVIFGNSGGAVVNDGGEIVGVVSQIRSFFKFGQRILVFHMGFCVPQHIMIPFLQEAYENLQQEVPAES